ncbi:MAG: PGF-CTERM sorting domain-containing protein [ANME-2 cluster archaeon]|jgi:hypothetical protein|nr:PGF-CTERM sorting domain-containing protein [ANME-2 cluster archaeon]
MKETIQTIKRSVCFFVIIILSSMTIATIAIPDIPNMFYGSVTLNGEPAPTGTTINAYIDEEIKGSILVQNPGIYGDDSKLSVGGINGSTISFTVNGVEAEQTAIWQEYSNPQKLDLTSGEYSTTSDDNISNGKGSISNSEDIETSAIQTKTVTPVVTYDEKTHSSEEKNQTPGFGMIYAIIGLLSIIYLIKLSIR